MGENVEDLNGGFLGAEKTRFGDQRWIEHRSETR
jgi:hypothetical protein